MGSEWINPEHWRQDMNTQDRDFWRGYNRRKHVYFTTPREEQREAFLAECERPEPVRKPITGRVLGVVR